MKKLEVEVVYRIILLEVQFWGLILAGLIMREKEPFVMLLCYVLAGFSWYAQYKLRKVYESRNL